MTNKIYTDENLLGTWTAFDALPNYTERASQIASQVLVANGQDGSLPVTTSGGVKAVKLAGMLVKVTFWHYLSRVVPSKKMAGAAGLEPVTSAVTGQRSNQLSYAPALGHENLGEHPAKVNAEVKKSGRQTPRRWGWGNPLKKRAATRII
jgi:hypothetical protein